MNEKLFPPSHQSKTPASLETPPGRPSVFDYSDYRTYLAESFHYLKSKNPSYSENAFGRQIGLSQSSRGYLGLIIKGKRNISPKTMAGISQALKHNHLESQYFETLVNFNQAQNNKEKSHYFERLSQMVKGKEGPAYLLLKSQYEYLSHWYYVAIRELVSLNDFQENPHWIAKKLKNKITAKEAGTAIQHLLQLGMLVRNDQNKLVQGQELVEFKDTSLNYTVTDTLHAEFMDLAKEVLQTESYEERSISHVVLACHKDSFLDLRKDIADFRAKIIEKYGHQGASSDSVINLSLSLYSLTEQNVAATKQKITEQQQQERSLQ